MKELARLGWPDELARERPSGPEAGPTGRGRTTAQRNGADVAEIRIASRGTKT